MLEMADLRYNPCFSIVHTLLLAQGVCPSSSLIPPLLAINSCPGLQGAQFGNSLEGSSHIFK